MESALLRLGTLQKLQEVNGLATLVDKHQYELHQTILNPSINSSMQPIIFIMYHSLCIYIYIFYIYIFKYLCMFVWKNSIFCGSIPVLRCSRATEGIPCFIRAWARIDLAPGVGFVAMGTAVEFLAVSTEIGMDGAQKEPLKPKASS